MDVIVSCPYDKTHRIRRSKLLYHLVRCRRNNNHSTIDLKISCPFDALHIVNENTFENHVKECLTTGNVKGEVHNLELQKLVGVVPLEAVKNLVVPTMENWKEENVETYDPWKNTAIRNIIRCRAGGSKAEKRQFRLAERRRLQALDKEYKFQQTICFKRHPLKVYESISQLARNQNRMSVENFVTFVESIDLNKLHNSEINKFHEMKHVTQLAQKVIDVVSRSSLRRTDLLNHTGWLYNVLKRFCKAGLQNSLSV